MKHKTSIEYVISFILYEKYHSISFLYHLQNNKYRYAQIERKGKLISSLYQ